ncbi:MAG TPA: hypothetical protein VNM22_15230 [Candidatus Limnocylindrales bacterium]|nr:hypothetical protein [Candidatus Limnocylindrales bacterium]
MWKKPLKILGVIALLVLMPVLVQAHGDDQVTVNSLFGPLLAIFTIFILVPLGKVAIRGIKKQKEERI